MKEILTLLLLVALISCKDQAVDQPLPLELNPIGKNMDDYFTALTNLQQFNGVVLAYKNDSLLLEKAYNINESPHSSTYVTLDHQFDIHSISKLMAYYLIVKLGMKGCNFYRSNPRSILSELSQRKSNHR